MPDFENMDPEELKAHAELRKLASKMQGPPKDLDDRLNKVFGKIGNPNSVDRYFDQVVETEALLDKVKDFTGTAKPKPTYGIDEIDISESLARQGISGSFPVESSVGSSHLDLPSARMGESDAIVALPDTVIDQMYD